MERTNMIGYLKYFADKQRKILSAIFFLIMLFHCQNLSAQTVLGKIIDINSKEPLSNVVVMVIDTTNIIRATQLSDTTGAFLITNIKLKKIFIRTYRLGYAYVNAGPYNLAGYDTLSMTIKLEALPFMLDEAIVTAKKTDPYLDEVHFYDRKKMGFGHYITWDDFKNRGLSSAYDIFRSIPGLIVKSENIFFARYAASSLNATAVQPLIYVDGTLLIDGNDNLGSLNPDIVLGVEVYNGITAPIQYSRGQAGGVILIWTKH